MRPLLVLVLTAALVVPAWAKDIVVTESDFTCMRAWPKIEGHKPRLFHQKKRLLKKAIHILLKGKPGKHYPVGTMVELVPPIRGGTGQHVFRGEVMVKHKKGFNPEGGDWEFFVIDWRDADGSTVIVKQGKGEVVNVGPPCQSCHGKARQFDFVCEGPHGCDPIALSLSPSQFAVLQDLDPRCPAGQ